jgi:ATP-dependent protease ClpP protease subunit
MEVILKALICIFAAYFATAEVNLNLKNTVTLRGEVNDNSILDLQDKLALLDAERDSEDYPIYLVIDSRGGSIQAGLNFIEFAKTIKNLHTINLYAASMASAIQQALPGKRIGLENSVSMFHRPSGEFKGQFGEGEVESKLQFSKDRAAIFESINAARMQLSLADYKAKVVKEYWVVGAENLKQHIVDEIDSIRCDNALIKATEDLEEVRFSSCPLFRTGRDISTITPKNTQK